MNETAVGLLLKERALESTSEGVVISDCTEPGMPIIYVNRAFTVMTGYTSEEVLGRNCRFLQGPDTDGSACEEIRKAIAAQVPCKVEILNYHKDGRSFWNELSITPVRDETGQTTHFIGIQSDVTRRRHAEQSLRRANEELKRDLRAAALVQQAQLPKRLPDVEGFRFAWRFHPCQELAGDTLNILRLDEDHVGVYVLDVSGHGVRAALHSFSLSQDLRPRQDGPCLQAPDEVLRQLNNKYPVDAQTGMFFTILYGIVDVRQCSFTFASAGHPGPVLLRDGQPPQLIETRSFPVGISTEPEYRSETVQLRSGDKLLLYTDGVAEAMSARDIPFGDERFLRVLGRHQQQPIDEVLDAVLKAMENWACHVNLRDDISLVGVEVI
jgi:PAS domain S-box-containing protein